jgi:hypothetical protein
MKPAPRIMTKQHRKTSEKRRFALFGFFRASCSNAMRKARPPPKKIGIVAALIDQIMGRFQSV